MKVVFFVASTLIASVQCAAIENRQIFRPTTRPGSGYPPNGPDGTQPSPPWISIGPPRVSTTFYPNDPPRGGVSECGLDAFEGHTSEAYLFCSSILRSGTATVTQTTTTKRTSTVTTTIATTLPRPTTSRTPTPSTSRTPTPSTSRTPSPSSPPPISTRTPTPTPPTTPTTSSPPPSTTTGPGCGLVGYTKTTAAYNFDSTGTKNTFAACSAACKADAKCKGFGYGEANCLLFDIPVNDNINYNPMSPYTFYNVECPAELPVKKRQINISLPPILGGPRDISSACSCLITSGPAGVTRTSTATVTSGVAVTQTFTRTVTPVVG
ncbi:hypothetical protein GQ43DRAFT_479826 [Delitschia confertaspora ATCC 74209]|uniref:Apple domain-containing protein n=1 Tax=Delitschia confertaspora ATCC 74209 TaxID=1513339 RepID=A0A9P4JQE9_9PLEO|nr:hypothetical protein GQ43DRAFT_479826 [Delitschia confertaspora ATCC 74209]